MVIADIGHFESEQFTIDLLYDLLAEKFPTFAVLKTGTTTNPVNYYAKYMATLKTFPLKKNWLHLSAFRK